MDVVARTRPRKKADVPQAVRTARRRRPYLVVVLAVGLGLLGVGVALAVYEGISRYRPPLAEGESYGVDVSHYQEAIDWERVAADDISFAYIKATEGETWVDERFADNWAQADDAGVTRGAYHFFSLCSPGAGQARNFLDVVPDDPDALPPAIDLEFSACTRRPDAATVERELHAFVDMVERETGERVVLYVLPPFEERYPIFDDLPRDRWERSIFRHPDREWAVWQVSGTARVEGIKGRADLNVWRASP